MPVRLDEDEVAVGEHAGDEAERGCEIDTRRRHWVDAVEAGAGVTVSSATGIDGDHEGTITGDGDEGGTRETPGGENEGVCTRGVGLHGGELRLARFATGGMGYRGCVFVGLFGDTSPICHPGLLWRN